VFVSVKHASLAELPRRARVGTSSQRRRAQLKALRRDIEAVEFRGNVDTRLRKLAEGQVDAILLAAAGLDRLGKTDWVRERLDPQDFCPAAGQVPIGIHCRPSFSENASSGSWVEIFGVVASPDSGQIVRVHLHAPLQNTDPVSLGHEAAEMLLAQGAGPLLAAGSSAPGGAA
jgi:hydroxymethylbilane synthase